MTGPLVALVGGAGLVGLGALVAGTVVGFGACVVLGGGVGLVGLVG